MWFFIILFILLLPFFWALLVHTGIKQTLAKLAANPEYQQAKKDLDKSLGNLADEWLKMTDENFILERDIINKLAENTWNNPIRQQQFYDEYEIPDKIAYKLYQQTIEKYKNNSQIPTKSVSSLESEALQSLITLGYSQRVSEKAISSAMSEPGHNTFDAKTLVKHALAYI